MRLLGWFLGEGVPEITPSWDLIPASDRWLTLLRIAFTLVLAGCALAFAVGSLAALFGERSGHYGMGRAGRMGMLAGVVGAIGTGVAVMTVNAFSGF